MPEWDELMQDHFFITDLGAEQDTFVSGVRMTVGRYAVWSPSKHQHQHIIVEVGSDLDSLQKKYSVSDERVCRIAG